MRNLMGKSRRLWSALLLLVCLATTTLIQPTSAFGDAVDDPHDHESTESDVPNVVQDNETSTTEGADASAFNHDLLNDKLPQPTAPFPANSAENENGSNSTQDISGDDFDDDNDDDNDPVEQPPPPRWTGIDTIVAIFFAVAAMWLIAATIYSIMLILLIRLQSRGELDIYDENLGRWTFCNGRFSLHFGCIVRRYAIQLERDYQRRLHAQFGEGAEGEEPFEPAPIRIMTREERRQAVEELLGIKPPGKSSHSTSTEESSSAEDCDDDQCKDHETPPSTNASEPASPSRSENSSLDGPVCSICLDSYSPTDVIFRSQKCAHMFHKDCLMEWLERRSNTECPCCRDPLVSDEEVWETVKRMRKERRRQLRKENSYTHRFIQWMLLKRRQRRNQLSEHHRSSASFMDSDTSPEEDPEAQLEQRSDGEGTNEGSPAPSAYNDDNISIGSV